MLPNGACCKRSSTGSRRHATTYTREGGAYRRALKAAVGRMPNPHDPLAVHVCWTPPRAMLTPLALPFNHRVCQPGQRAPSPNCKSSESAREGHVGVTISLHGPGWWNRIRSSGNGSPCGHAAAFGIRIYKCSRVAFDRSFSTTSHGNHIR